MRYFGANILVSDVGDILVCHSAKTNWNLDLECWYTWLQSHFARLKESQFFAVLWNVASCGAKQVDIYTLHPQQFFLTGEMHLRSQFYFHFVHVESPFFANLVKQTSVRSVLFNSAFRSANQTFPGTIFHNGGRHRTSDNSDKTTWTFTEVRDHQYSVRTWAKNVAHIHHNISIYFVHFLFSS